MRPSRHQMYMAMARAASTRSTCFRLNVGAVLVDRATRNVVSIGYNGAPSGVAHCTGNGCPHMTPAGCKVVHAEINAIARASSVVVVDAVLDLYVTHSPCLACAERVASFGVSAVYFETAYRDPTPVDYLRVHGVTVLQLLPSGLGADAAGDLVKLA